MSNTSILEIKKLNGQNFEMWKLKIEDLLVDQEQWITATPRTKPMGTSNDDWEKLDMKSQSNIWLCHADSTLMNVSGEDTAKTLWDKLGNLYQPKPMVNKLFLRYKLYILSISDDDSVIEHLNAFNTVIS